MFFPWTTSIVELYNFPTRMDIESIFQCFGNDFSGWPPDFGIEQNPLFEFWIGQFHTLVKSFVKILIGIIPMRSQIRNSGGQCCCDVIPSRGKNVSNKLILKNFVKTSESISHLFFEYFLFLQVKL